MTGWNLRRDEKSEHMWLSFNDTIYLLCYKKNCTTLQNLWFLLTCSWDKNLVTEGTPSQLSVVYNLLTLYWSCGASSIRAGTSSNLPPTEIPNSWIHGSLLKFTALICNKTKIITQQHEPKCLSKSNNVHSEVKKVQQSCYRAGVAHRVPGS